MKQQINLQDVFLNRVRKDKIVITIFLVNGFQIRGTVLGFDSYTVVVDSDGKQEVVYKHAISTITPVKPLGTQNAEKSADDKAADAKTDDKPTEEAKAE